MITVYCSECDNKFNADGMKAHIGTKFLLFDYAYIICPRCWHKIVIPEQYYKNFGIKYDY